MIVFVFVAFLYMLILGFLLPLCIVRSSKFMVLFYSVVILNCKCLSILLIFSKIRSSFILFWL